jgi:hypothetical protein
VLSALATIGALALLCGMGAMAWRGNRGVAQAKGVGYLVKGYGWMVLMRMRQNRHDFFKQAPVVSNVRMGLLAVFAHECARGTVVSEVLPWLVVALSVLDTAENLRPPLWLLLGRSRFDAYHLFTTLRHAWGEQGINLLDRSSDEWLRYYQHWRQAWIRAGLPMAGSLLNNPRIRRQWSLRPRGELWMPSAQSLMAFLPAVVIDAREASRYIDDEILWAIELDCLDKVWLVAADDGSAPAVQSALDWAHADQVPLPAGSVEALARRVVGKERLAQARWSRGVLVVPAP